ncbi:GAF domain-containing sensor histidine kinase [Sphingobium agri]|uniref:histidine kinase n=1 Tax=Sphingobium agri TaxID=2933566 RepID=A0ABT0E160_9SPHN|nr:GAF domain-containing sensor histidine kinase [Sphingobium agri]MCK0533109.1 GAF domain-containing sensor histidine kinase [Sphingobium agri]
MSGTQERQQHSGTVKPPIPADEADRLQALEHYRLGGIGREQPFDHITQFAADLFDAPMSLVSIVGSDAQCFRGACGIDETHTPRDVAFCAFAILQPEVMVVPDAAKDPRFRSNPLVTGAPHIRFYAGAPLRVANGQPIGTLCIIDHEPRDFGEQEQKRLAQLARTVVDLIEFRVEGFAAEEHRRKLDDERQLLKLTVENVSGGVAVVDRDLRLMLWNQAFVDLFDYAPDSVTGGRDARDLIRLTAQRGELGPGDPDQIVTGFVESIRTSDSRRLEIQRRNGRILDIRRESIRGGRFIMTARDVTQERQISRLKDELVSTVSHELRTPLTAISGALGLMAGGAAGELPDRAKQLVAIGSKNAERLIHLVNDLLDMDKLQSGKLVFHFEGRELGLLLTEAIEQIEPYAERFGVRLAFERPTDAVVAKVDSNRLCQVMTNLLSNACKFSPSGGTVRVSLQRAGDSAHISVADEGPGISPEFRARLFKRFEQEDGAHQQGHAGTGLGLAISKAIVEAHGGSITLDPETEKGATFRVELPAVTAS